MGLETIGIKLGLEALNAISKPVKAALKEAVDHLVVVASTTPNNFDDIAAKFLKELCSPEFETANPPPEPAEEKADIVDDPPADPPAAAGAGDHLGPGAAGFDSKQ